MTDSLGGFRREAEMTLAVRVNGERATYPAGSTLADVVAGLSCGGRGTAVARNGEVVPRSRWHRTPLVAEDAVEVLTAAQGG